VSRFLEEIREQPEALRRLVEHLRGAGRAPLEAARDLCAGRQLSFVGMGSSHYAPLAVRPALLRNGVRAEVWEAGELLHYHLESFPGEGAVVAISQSGESAETLRVVEQLDPGHPLVAITNAAESGFGRRGHVLLPLCAGHEAAISTKTYTNTLALLHLLTAALTGGDLEDEGLRLEALAGVMEAVLVSRRDEMDAAAGFLREAAFLYFVARGPSLAAAHQAALTFNEGARLPTCALAGGSFRHGPLELVGEAFAGIFLAPAGSTWELSMAVAREVAEAGGRALLLTDQAPPGRSGRLRVVELAPCGEDLFPLGACVPAELLLHRMARDRGREAGVFERISKVTRHE